jgi:hypothetical protein
MVAVKKEDETYNVLGTFHLVVKVKAGEDINDVLFNGTDWLAEPLNGKSVVISMIPKLFNQITGGKVVETYSAKAEVDIVAPVVKKKSCTKEVKECRTCGSKTCGMLAGVCKKWEAKEVS